MCDVCNSENINYKERCGKHDKLYVNKFHLVYKNSTAAVKMCYLHDIEFFHLGERRFLMDHINLAKVLQTKAG